MGIFRTWKQIGTTVAAFTPAGPIISTPAAEAAVVRLHRSVTWARPRLADISGLSEAAMATSQVVPLVVDRLGLIGALADSLDKQDRLAPSVGESSSQIIHLGGILGFRQLAMSTKCYWMLSGPPRVFLVAPNIWQAADSRQLDQVDYAKWVALRAGLWGTYFSQAPWLRPYLLRLLLNASRGTMELVRSVLLLSELVNGQLQSLTPADIPSVNWIREYAPASGAFEAVRQLSSLGIKVPDLYLERSRIREFVRQLGLDRDSSGLKILLRGPEYLPTIEELSNPKLWAERVYLV